MKYLLLVFLSTNLLAKEKHHAHLGAHVHGDANINIVIEGAKGTLLIDSPAESFLGFEGKPKNEKQKNDLKKLEKINLSQNIKFDPSLECQFSNSKFAMEGEGDHSNINISADFNCKKEIKGTKINLDFTSFKHLKEFKLEMMGSKTISKEFKNKATTVEQ